MPSVLGKRKQRAPPAEKTEAELEAAQAILRKHFEAKFAPLPEIAPVRVEQEEKDLRSESSEDSEWDGLSGDNDDDEEDDQVEVVDHTKTSTTAALPTTIMSKREMRAYLSSRPPDTITDPSTATTKPRTKKPTTGDDQDGGDENSAQLLANDLALQRLISESHILSAANSFSSTSGFEASDAAAKQKASFAAGRTRALTTDLRMQTLGSKTSIFAQKKMPMGMRQGINAAAGSRERKRRREAKENGIILERETTTGKAGRDGSGKLRKKRGDPRVDAPGMGKFVGGELRLSKHEIRAVEMEGKPRDSGKKRRRRR